VTQKEHENQGNQTGHRNQTSQSI